MKTVRVDIRGLFQDASAFSGYVRFELSRPSQQDDVLILPHGPFGRVELSSGRAEAALIPNSMLGEDTFYRFSLVRVDMRGMGRTESTVLSGTCVVPNADCSITEIMDVLPGKEDAPTAEKYASEAKYAAVQAKAQANAAQGSAENAEILAAEAGRSAMDAEKSADASARHAEYSAAKAEEADMHAQDAAAHSAEASRQRQDAEGAAERAASAASSAQEFSAQAESMKASAQGYAQAAESASGIAQSVAAQAEEKLQEVENLLSSGQDYSGIFKAELEA